jgi:carbon-monoxide dehydrogenase medium subunit
VISVYPRRFEYVRPQDVAEAVRLLSETEDARVLAGGQSLIPMMKLRLVSPPVVVDIGRLPLGYVAETPDGVRVGALVRHVQAEDSSVLRRRFPLMRDAVRHIADPQVRNLGTVGGSVAHADPAGDWLPVLMALGAVLRTAGPGGERRLPARGFAVGPYETALAPGEILTEIEIPDPPPGSAGCFLKVERRTGGFALASAAVQLTLDGRDCAGVGIALGGAGPSPMVAAGAEAALRGRRLTAEAVEEAAAAAAAECRPYTDVRASAEYRRVLVRALVRRGLEIARRRCLGEEVEARVLA